MKGTKRGDRMFYLFLFLLILIIFKIKLNKYNFEKELRKCESPIEELLLKKLHKEGYKPVTQVSCGSYRIDIALYIRRKKIAIECDGKAFHSSPEQLEHDERKNIFLEKNRWQVVRFAGTEIYRDPNWCSKVIRKRFG